MTAAQTKIIECSTGDFGAQATLYSSVLVDAYQAANVKVAVSDMRAAVERHNEDGSVDVLVAVRVKVTNSEAADQEQGYRLRVNMAPDEGTYKIARLDQVTFVTAVLDMNDPKRLPKSAPEPPPASWPARAGAFAVDVLLGIAVIATMALLGLDGAAARLAVVGVHRRGRVRSSWRRRQPAAAADDHRVDAWAARCSASRCAQRDGAAAGLARLVAGIWRTCWTPRRCSSAGCGRCGTAAHRTFADLLLRTEVHKCRPTAARRAPPGRGGAASWRRCCAQRVSGLSYLVVYRHDRAVDTAREQIAAQGPADRRADAELRHRHAAAGLLATPSR